MQIETVKISTLAEDPNNARKHGEANMRAIKGSLAKFGQQKPIVVSMNNVVLAGNGTLRAAMELGWKDIKIVRTSLVGYEASAFALADNRTAELAEWDKPILGNTLMELKEIEFDLPTIGFEELNADIFGEEEKEEKAENKDTDEEKYTKKIKSPIYEPKEITAPEINTLIDLSKTCLLLKQIDECKANEDVKTFLRHAAQRHTIFNYEKIAEFYCHASKEIQCLMENSALIIIDFKKAIENGFVSLSEKLANAYEDDNNDE